MAHAPLDAGSTSADGHRRPIPVDQLSVVQQAFHELALCDSLEAVKDVRDKAEAVRQYARSAKAGLELQNKAAELKLRAERRAGELLHAMGLRGGDRVSGSACCRMTLEQLGISHNQSTRWQKLASIPEAEFAEFLRSAYCHGVEISTACLLRMASSRARKRVAPQDLSGVCAGRTQLWQPSTTSPCEIIAELLDHCQVLDSILSPICDRDGPVELCSAERRHLRRLIRDFKSLIADLQAHTVIGNSQG